MYDLYRRVRTLSEPKVHGLGPSSTPVPHMHYPNNIRSPPVLDRFGADRFETNRFVTTPSRQPQQPPPDPLRAQQHEQHQQRNGFVPKRLHFRRSE